jgi:hypothetical protein
LSSCRLIILYFSVFAVCCVIAVRAGSSSVVFRDLYACRPKRARPVASMGVVLHTVRSSAISRQENVFPLSKNRKRDQQQTANSRLSSCRLRILYFSVFAVCCVIAVRAGSCSVVFRDLYACRPKRARPVASMGVVLHTVRRRFSLKATVIV